MDVNEDSPQGQVQLTPWQQGPLVVLVTLLITGLVVSVLLLQVWHRVRIVELGYKMTALTKERRMLLEERERLGIEAAVSTRTERLEQVARDSLDLHPFRPDQIITVDPVKTAARQP